MASKSRQNAEASTLAGTALHAFNVNTKGQLVYTKSTIPAGTSPRLQTRDGTDLYEQYHVGHSGMEYYIDSRGKFALRLDTNG
jgi:hypothetical protein